VSVGDEGLPSREREIAALARQIAVRLTARGERLAIVESSLGGLVGAHLTRIPGASTWFAATVATYSTEAKSSLLGVRPQDLAKAGAVSPDAAQALARALRSRLPTEWTLAETGIAGPRGTRRSAKEPGTLCVHVIGPRDVEIARAVLTGLDDRDANRNAFAAAVLQILVGAISDADRCST
jgi:PncC family amidohydrolase